MKISACNQLNGKVVGVQKGQTTAHVRDDLALKVGDGATAIIKASDVMIAK